MMGRQTKTAENYLLEKGIADSNSISRKPEAKTKSVLNEKVIRLGHVWMVVIITLVTVIMAVFVVYTLLHFFADDRFPVAFTLKIAAVTPLFIAPVIAWPLIGSHLKLAAMENSYYIYATYDMLTGVLTRYAFFNNLSFLQELSSITKSPFSIAIIDIDNFKNINDTYGHAAGDEILKSLGDLIQSSIRGSDFAGRLGGDELAVVFPNTKLDDAKIVAEKIRLLAENTVISFDRHQLKFSLSIGVSQSDIPKPATIKQVLEASDKALYLAKKQGKNCIVLSE